MHLFRTLYTLVFLYHHYVFARYDDLSIEEVASTISDPYSDDFRQFLSAQEAAIFAQQLPEISYATKATKRWNRRNELASQHGHRAVNIRNTCGADDLVTPACIRQVYGIDYVPQPSRVTFAVYATEGASYNPQDLTSYLQNYRPEAVSATYEVIGSGDPSQTAGIEAQFEVALDTQTLLGTAWPAKALLYNAGGVFGPDRGKPYKPFVDFLDGLIKNESVPSVVSFSESMPEDMMEAEYARTLCSMMALAGTRGISLLFSSGDNGPNGDTADGAHDNIFEPEFPASCPWVTAVGGTTNLADETAATTSTIPAFDSTFYKASGGGFSNLFQMPDYQREAVTSYVEEHVPGSYFNASGFNAQGRGIPDLSAFSTNIPTVVNGASLPLGGTSASTPLWAAIITLLNDREAREGRPPLGFLNPWLYSLDSTALTDLTTGGNSKGSCNALTGCNLTETLGYDVVSGWDPVTGLGSPIFSELAQALDDLQDEC